MKRTSRQVRLLPKLEPIRDGDGLTIGDLTTRHTTEALLFDVPLLNKGTCEKESLSANRRAPMTTSPSSTRRRVCATYCPRCNGWVEVRLQPVRLRCIRCGVEAKP